MLKIGVKKYRRWEAKNSPFLSSSIMQQLYETSTNVDKSEVSSSYATSNKDHSTLSAFNALCFFINSNFIIFHWLLPTLISSSGSANRDLSRAILKGIKFKIVIFRSQNFTKLPKERLMRGYRSTVFSITYL